MEISIEAITGLLGLLLTACGGGAFFTWKYMKRKAKAEAVTAEVDAAKEMQDLYKKMLNDANEYLEDARNKVEGLRQERDHYKQDRDDLRDQVQKLTKMYYDMKTEGEKERSELRIKINNVSSQLQKVIPLTCTVIDCKLRQVLTLIDQPKPKKGKGKNDIEPSNEEL